MAEFTLKKKHKPNYLCTTEVLDTKDPPRWKKNGIINMFMFQPKFNLSYLAFFIYNTFKNI